MKFDREAGLAVVKKHLEIGIAARKLLADTGMAPIVAAAEHIARRMEQGSKLLICGNGGSAADSQHLAAEFTCQLTKDFARPGLPAIALTTDTSALTAYANDFGFEGIFARQVEALGRPGDMLLGISTSGGSSNVVRAFETAKGQDLTTIALCGEKGRLLEMADFPISVQAENNQLVQELHLAIEHVICHMVERALFG